MTIIGAERNTNFYYIITQLTLTGDLFPWHSQSPLNKMAGRPKDKNFIELIFSIYFFFKETTGLADRDILECISQLLLMMEIKEIEAGSLERYFSGNDRELAFRRAYADFIDTYNNIIKNKSIKPGT